MQGFLDGLVRSTKTVMTRVEFGGTLFLVAVIGVLLTSRDEGENSSLASCRPERPCPPDACTREAHATS